MFGGEYLTAPFPWFGGKRDAGDVIWPRLGACKNYVEPFAGSLAIMLRRPPELYVEGMRETINDLDCYLVNLYRAIAWAPDEVARWACYPVTEADLTARHGWLLGRAEFRRRMLTDPHYHSAKIAGWWLWGQCAWLGSGWCDLDLLAPGRKVPEQLPHLGNAGHGINRAVPSEFEGDRDAFVRAWIAALSRRMRDVRIANGEWYRVLSDAVTTAHGTTAILFDPPYAEGNVDYGAGGVGAGVSAAVRAWCLANGENPRLRIALCGLDGEHPGLVVEGWDCVEWKGRKGYRGEEDNRRRERVWFSPHCLGS